MYTIAYKLTAFFSIQKKKKSYSLLRDVQEKIYFISIWTSIVFLF